MSDKRSCLYLSTFNHSILWVIWKVCAEMEDQKNIKKWHGVVGEAKILITEAYLEKLLTISTTYLHRRCSTEF